MTNEQETNGNISDAVDNLINETVNNAPQNDQQTKDTHPFKLADIGVALLPVTPIPFSGGDALYSWGRLVLYGGLSATLYNKNRTASMIFGAAAGLSLLTSLSAKSWEKSK